MVVAEELVGELLVRPDRDRPVGVVLEAGRRVLFVVEADRVVETEQQAVAEPPIHRNLHRVVSAPPDRLLLVDGGKAPIVADQIGVGRGIRGCRVRGGRRRRQRRILVRGQERRAQIDAVQIDPGVGVVAVLPGVGHVERGRERQHRLDAGVPLRGRAEPVLVLPHRERRRGLGSEAGRGHVLQFAVANGHVARERRVVDRAIDRVGRRAIVEQADAAADDELLIAFHVPRDADAGRGADRLDRVVVLRHRPLAGRKDAVGGRPGVGHERADRQRRVRPEHLTGRRVQRAPVRGGARVDVVDAPGDVQAWRLLRRPLLRQEVRAEAVGVVLRAHVGEADAVVERQPILHAPVVLHEELVIDREVGAFGPAGRLRIGAEDADRRIGEPERGVERVVGVVGEADVAGDVAGAAPLQAAEVVVARLQRVAAGHLGQAGVPGAVARVENEVRAAGDARVRPEGPDIRVRRVRHACAPRELRRRRRSACRPTSSCRPD